MATDFLIAKPVPVNSVTVDSMAGNSLSSKMCREGSLTSVKDTSPVSQPQPSQTAGRDNSQTRVRQLTADLVELTKPRIVAMILVTTLATALIGAGTWVPAGSLFWLLVGTACVAGSAGAANQVWERVIDREMTRTASRPLPGGRMTTSVASAFTLTTGLLGSCILWLGFGPVPALVGMATWALYVLVYTPMKTRTSLNTTVGAIAGALPVLIGYTACGGLLADVTGWLLFGVLVAWQYPHFMAIAWLYRRQYHEAGFLMSTTVQPSGISAGLQAVAGSIAVVVCGTALCFVPGHSLSGYVAAAVVVAASLPMLRASIRFLGDRSDPTGRKLLLSSLWVLPAVLMAITTRVLW